MSGQDEILTNFINITNSFDIDNAKALLESTNWDLNQAVSLHYASTSNTASINTPIFDNITTNFQETRKKLEKEFDTSYSFKPEPNKFNVFDRVKSNDEMKVNDDSEICKSKPKDPFKRKVLPDLSLNPKTSKNDLRINGTSIHNIQLNITNKHNKLIFKKSYHPDTIIEKVRKDACNHFKIPLDLAIWNLPDSFNDQNHLKDLNKNVVNLVIENVMANFERTNDYQIGATNSTINISSDEDKDYQPGVMEISSDEDAVDINNFFNKPKVQKSKPTTRNDKKLNSTYKSNKITDRSGQNSSSENIEENSGLLPKSFNNVPQAVNYMVKGIKDRFPKIKTFPEFVIGSMGDCLSNTVSVNGENCPWNEYERIITPGNHKPTIILLNHEESISKNIFLSQILFKEPVSSLLKQTSVWCWDNTSDTNAIRLGTFLDKHFEKFNNKNFNSTNRFGQYTSVQRFGLAFNNFSTLSAKNKIDQIDKTDYPLLILVSQDPENCKNPQISEILKGTDSLEKVTQSILNLQALQTDINHSNKQKDLDRSKREQLRHQQQEEYQKAIDKDLQIKNQQKIDQNNKQMEEAIKKSEQEAIETDKDACIKFIGKIDRRVKKLNSDNLTIVKLRTPSGLVTKEFPSEMSSDVLFKWASTLDYPKCNLISTYPRKVLRSGDKLDSLKSIFGKQGQLNLDVIESDEDDSSDEE